MPAPCVICGDPQCVYERLGDLEGNTRYFLGEPEDEREVTEEEFVRAERQAGFYNTLGHPEKPATAGFSTTAQGGMRGRVSYGD